QYPRYAEAYYNRGVAQGKLGNDKAAIADYSQALKIDSKLAEAYQERGLLWQKQGNKKRAIGDLKKAASLYKKEGNESAYQSVQEILDKLSRI
ncbi:MAG: tetratricopeptide repeat protein, partial [Microcystaceae cyanobacterium]